MLLWQQNMHEFHDALYLEVRWDIARKAFLYALILYMLLFLSLFISSVGQSATVTTIVAHSDSAPVLFMSAHANKKTAHAGRPFSHGEKKTSKKNVSPQKKKEQKSLPPKSKEKIIEKKPSSKIKTPEVVPAKKTAIKKPEPKKAELVKKIEPAKTKMAQEKKVIKAEKPQEQSKPEPKASVSARQVPELKISEDKRDEEQPSEILVALSRDDKADHAVDYEYDAQTKAHIALSRAIGRVWKAPRVKIKQPAEALVEIDTEGNPISVQLEKKSGAHLHDIESRAAALRAVYPQEFWGKKIRIIFGD